MSSEYENDRCVRCGSDNPLSMGACVDCEDECEDDWYDSQENVTFVQLDRTIRPEDTVSTGLSSVSTDLTHVDFDMRKLREMVPSWTQNDLAEILGISVNSVRKLIANKPVKLSPPKQNRIRAAYLIVERMSEILYGSRLLLWFHSATWDDIVGTPLEILSTGTHVGQLVQKVTSFGEYTIT